MATLNSIEQHQITSKSRVVLESPEALMSSQYVCGTSRPDTAHIIHNLSIRVGSGEMQRMQALIDCGTMNILMSPRLRKRLGLPDQPAYVTTLGLSGHAKAHACESRKTAFMVQYMEHLSPVQESEVPVVPIWAHDLVLGLPQFQSSDPIINRQHARLLILRTPGGGGVAAVHWVDLHECPPNVPRSMSREEACSEEGGGIPDIQILGTTAFADLLPSPQVVGTFFPRVGNSTGLQGATVEGITDGESDRPQALD